MTGRPVIVETERRWAVHHLGESLKGTPASAGTEMSEVTGTATPSTDSMVDLQQLNARQSSPPVKHQSIIPPFLLDTAREYPLSTAFTLGAAVVLAAQAGGLASRSLWRRFIPRSSPTSTVLHDLTSLSPYFKAQSELISEVQSNSKMLLEMRRMLDISKVQEDSKIAREFQTTRLSLDKIQADMLTASNRHTAAIDEAEETQYEQWLNIQNGQDILREKVAGIEKAVAGFHSSLEAKIDASARRLSGAIEKMDLERRADVDGLRKDVRFVVGTVQSIQSSNAKILQRFDGLDTQNIKEEHDGKAELAALKDEVTHALKVMQGAHQKAMNAMTGFDNTKCLSEVLDVKGLVEALRLVVEKGDNDHRAGLGDLRKRMAQVSDNLEGIRSDVDGGGTGDAVGLDVVQGGKRQLSEQGVIGGPSIEATKFCVNNDTIGGRPKVTDPSDLERRGVKVEHTEDKSISPISTVAAPSSTSDSSVEVLVSSKQLHEVETQLETITELISLRAQEIQLFPRSWTPSTRSFKSSNTDDEDDEPVQSQITEITRLERVHHQLCELEVVLDELSPWISSSLEYLDLQGELECSWDDDDMLENMRQEWKEGEWLQAFGLEEQAIQEHKLGGFGGRVCEETGDFIDRNKRVMTFDEAVELRFSDAKNVDDMCIGGAIFMRQHGEELPWVNPEELRSRRERGQGEVRCMESDEARLERIKRELREEQQEVLRNLRRVRVNAQKVKDENGTSSGDSGDAVIVEGTKGNTALHEDNEGSESNVPAKSPTTAAEATNSSPSTSQQLKASLNNDGVFNITIPAGVDQTRCDTGEVTANVNGLGQPHLVDPAVPGDIDGGEPVDDVAVPVPMSREQDLERLAELLDEAMIKASSLYDGILFLPDAIKYPDVPSSSNSPGLQSNQVTTDYLLSSVDRLGYCLYYAERNLHMALNWQDFRSNLINTEDEKGILANLRVKWKVQEAALAEMYQDWGLRNLDQEIYSTELHRETGDYVDYEGNVLTFGEAVDRKIKDVDQHNDALIGGKAFMAKYGDEFKWTDFDQAKPENPVQRRKYIADELKRDQKELRVALKAVSEGRITDVEHGDWTLRDSSIVKTPNAPTSAHIEGATSGAIQSVTEDGEIPLVEQISALKTQMVALKDEADTYVQKARQIRKAEVQSRRENLAQASGQAAELDEEAARARLAAARLEEVLITKKLEMKAKDQDVKAKNQERKAKNKEMKAQNASPPAQDASSEVDKAGKKGAGRSSDSKDKVKTKKNGKEAVKP